MSQHEPSAKLLFVHGAFSDTSVWVETIRELLSQGFDADAVPLDLASLAHDIARVRGRIRKGGGRTALIGHSYGGAVISGAAAGEPNVVALGFVAGFPLDRGESLEALTSQGEPPPVAGALRFSQDGWLSLSPEGYAEYFAGDLEASRALAWAASQRPIAGAAWRAALGEDPAWRQLPCGYLVTEDDHVLPAQAQEYFAERVSSRLLTRVTASHAVMISKPAEVARFAAQVAQLGDSDPR